MKMPPKEKVYEAWTAIADNRVSMLGNEAKVSSSDDTKEYTVRFSGNAYSSDDNATYWQGYPGYPVLAVQMLQGILPFDRAEAEKWKGVNWKAINTKYKNNYRAAVENIAEERGIDLKESERAVDAVMESLQELPLEVKRKVNIK